MNNNTIRINSYLQNEMSAEEKEIFETELIVNPDLQNEVYVQRRIAEAAFDAGLKTVFAKAIRKKILARKIMKWGTLILVSIITVLVFKYKESLKTLSGGGVINTIATSGEKPAFSRFINPPLSIIDVPYTEYNFDAEKGDTLFIPSGSIIYFPPSALTDSAGNLIKGTVNIRYREFSSPVDFFVSGIPMGYDSAGKKYNFESSGMCEINAYQNRKALFINPKSKPEINLSGNNKSRLHSLYFLDTVNRKWNYSGKDIVTEVKNILDAKPVKTPVQAIPNDYAELPVKPLRPVKADENRQSFSIEVDPGSFEELFAYDKLKFEVTDESTYRRSDADEHWDNAQLKHSSSEGIYIVTFRNASRSVSYKVRPVLEGADYAAALKVFNEKTKIYEQSLKNRLISEQKESDSISSKNREIENKIKTDNETNVRINSLIIARNKRMKVLWLRRLQAEKKQEDLLTLNQKIQKLQDETDYAKYLKGVELSSEIIRSFTINNFGIWNCDQPKYPFKEVPLFASYEDNFGNKLAFSSVAVVYKGLNGLAQFSSLQIRVMPQEENMIWSIQDSSFFYYSYRSFKESGINMNSKIFNFKMQKANKKITSYNDIKALTKNL